MNDSDELRDLWATDHRPGLHGAPELARLVETKTRRFDRIVKTRNTVEFVAAFLAAAIFVFGALGSVNFLERIGCIITAGSMVWVAFYIFKYGRTRADLDPNQDLARYKGALLDRYDRQIQLLKSVKYWYLLPPYVGLMIFIAGVFASKVRSVGLDWWDYAVPAFVTAVFALVGWLNEVRAVGWLRAERQRLLAIVAEDTPERKHS